ncbi:NF-kappa-B essential modulator-like [Ixodes scapularis]
MSTNNVVSELPAQTDGGAMDRERLSSCVRDVFLNTPLQQDTDARMQEPTPWKCGNIQLPKFIGYEDRQSPTDFLDKFENFCLVTGVPDSKRVRQVLPAALEGTAKLWWRFAGGFEDWETFVKEFHAEFASVDYKHRLKEELDRRTQHPQENLHHFIHVIAEFYDRIGETVSDEEKVRRVRRQMHPNFQDLCEGLTFANLREFAKEAGGVMERAWHRLKYVPPPPRMDQVAKDLAFGELHPTVPNQCPPSMLAAVSAGVAPQPWWPLHPAAVQSSYCKDQISNKRRMSTEAATAISAAPASHSDSGDDLMSDFVVLSKSPQEESLLVVENPALAQLQLSLPSGDISLDEAEQCVRDLLRENRELKDVLVQNSQKLREQYETFVDWKEQLSRAHEQHRQALERLQGEKEALAAQAARLGQRLKESEERSEALGRDLAEQTAGLKQQLKEAEQRCTQLQEKVRAQEELLARERRGSEPESPTPSQRSQEFLVSCEPVPGLVPNAGSQMSVSDVLVQLHQEQTKTAHQSEQIRYLSQELLKLNQHVKESSEQTTRLKEKLSQVEARKAEVAYHETARLAQLEAALLEKDAVVRALQEQSVQRASEVDELRQALLKAEQRHEKAKTDYAELLRTWQEFESSNESGEHTFVQVEARPGALRRQLEEARKEVQDKLVALAERERQLTGLRDERTRLRQELELMPPLQAQVDLFRTDYMAEKEARVGLESRVREQQRTIRELQERLTGLELAEQRTSR